MKLKMIFNFIFEEIAMTHRTLIGAGLVSALMGTAAAQNTTPTLEEKIDTLQRQMLEMQHELDTLREQQKTDTEEARKRQAAHTEQVQTVEDGTLTEFKTENRFVHRITTGLAYRPTPLVGFTLAYEYTWTNNGKSLAPVTNFLPAKAKEHDAHALLAGMTFGF
jgi:TolA-binding protein